MHLDLETDDVGAEVARLEALGAVRYDHQQERGYDFWVMRDPCVLTTRVLRHARPTPTMLALGQTSSYTHVCQEQISAQGLWRHDITQVGPH